MHKRMKMLLGGLILSMGLVMTTPVSYAAETQVNGEEDIELAYENIDNYYSTLSTSTWIRVKAFYSYWKKKGAKIIKCKTVNKLQKKAKIGDVIQLHDPNKGWHHSIIISKGSKGKFKYAAHDKDHKAADLNSIKKTKDNDFRIIRDYSGAL